MPVDTTAPGEQTYSSNAITADFKIDLFSSESQQVTEAIEQEKQAIRTDINAEIFGAAMDAETISTKEELTASADELSLFSTPLSYNTVPSLEGASKISPFLVAALLVAGAGGGFFVAQMVRKQKKKGESDVHTLNY